MDAQLTRSLNAAADLRIGRFIRTHGVDGYFNRHAWLGT
jgi:hypothetical protein